MPNPLVDEAKAAGGGDHRVTIHAKTLRLELLNVKADLQRKFENWSRTAPGVLSTCIGSAVSASLPDARHAEPAPHGEPAI
jgi:hypothetical protein